MSKNKKRIIQNQLLIKKFVFWWGIFPTSGGFTTCKKKKFFRRIFRLPGIYPMEGERMKKIIFLRPFSDFREFTH